jgi:outer membrane protein assembly factor BamB
MMKIALTTAAVVLVAGATLSMQTPPASGPASDGQTAGGGNAAVIPIGDWPELRGPTRDGTSRETGLLERWALNGENFLWRVPHGGRSSPVVRGNRVYVQNPVGREAALRERVMALDADTGQTMWEYRFSPYQSDVPPHRVGWSSPAVDSATGNIYAVGVGAEVLGLSSTGQLLWHRSFAEEWAAFTTHGGRTMSPIVDGDLVIVNAAVSNWGANAQRRQRFIALDKRTGDTVYASTPGVRPYDTSYSPPLIATINGLRLLIAPLGDGGIYAIKPQTGERVWGYMSSKRGLNTGVVVDGTRVIASHGDENLNTVDLGMIAALDGTATGDIKSPLWAVTGTQFGFSSPVISSGTIYQMDNVGVLHAFESATGKELWSERLGTSQRGNLVLADGKLYLGSESGQFFIVRPRGDRAEVLSKVELPISVESMGGSERTPEQVVSGVAVSRGRIFFVSSDAIYAIGARTATRPTGVAASVALEPGSGPPAFVQVTPTELVVTPGQKVALKARLFDDKGRLLRESPASWSLTGLKGTVTDGVFVASSDSGEQAGTIKATVGTIAGEARAKVVRPMPWNETFEGYADGAIPPGWINFEAASMSVATLDGQKVLHKAPLETLYKRARLFMGPVTWSNYTLQADVRAPTRRRQMGDIGLTAQRYSLVLYGTAQRLKIESWEPEIARTVAMPFKWEADTWYRMKIRVEPATGNAVRVQGKVWPAAAEEPSAWTIEKVDPEGHKQGAPGFFIDAQFGAYVDNLRLTANQQGTR